MCGSDEKINEEEKKSLLIRKTTVSGGKVRQCTGRKETQKEKMQFDQQLRTKKKKK